MMKEIVVRESLKESVSNYASELKLVKKFAPVSVIVGAYWLFLLLLHRESEGLIGIIMICLTPIACIFAAILAFMLVVFVVDSLMLIIHPCTYAFSYDEEHFMMAKNGKVVASVPHDAVKKIENPTKISMTVIYQEGDGENDISVDLSHLSRTDSQKLKFFMREYQRLKKYTFAKKQVVSTDKSSYHPHQLDAKSNQSASTSDLKDNKKTYEIERQKRPNLIKEETLALCGIALSFVTDRGKVDTIAENVVRQELREMESDDIIRLYQYWKEDIEDHLYLLKIFLSYNMNKRIYAAGFLAKVIKSRTDGGKNAAYIDAWKNVVRDVLGLPYLDSMDEAMRLFRYFT